MRLISAVLVFVTGCTPRPQAKQTPVSEVHVPPQESARAPRPKAPLPATEASSSDPPGAQLPAGIDERNHTLSRRVLNPVLESQSGLLRMVRIVPHQENGRVVGFRLFGIRPESLLSRLGFENGDLVTRVNGYDMATPDAALEAYAAIRNVEAIDVEVTRRGAPTRVQWRIVE